MAETKLKPCPFCGETPDVDDPRTFSNVGGGSKWARVQCCIGGPEVRTSYLGVEHWRDDAIRAWNERVEPTHADRLERTEGLMREAVDSMCTTADP